MISRNVTVIELMWTLVGIVGLAVTAVNFRTALLDLWALRASGKNGALLELAHTSGKGETSRLAGHSIIIAIGALSMTQPNPGGPWPTSTLGWVLVGELFAVVGILVYQSLLNRRSRRRLAQYLDPETPV